MTRTGRTYTPKETADYERAIRALYTGGRFPDGPISIKLVFDPLGLDMTIESIDHEKSKLRGDVDNYAKAILDALNEVAWSDDKQVVILEAEKR